VSYGQGPENGWLSGRIVSASGSPLEGVIVSARIQGEPITTSVYTDADGRYYFPAMKRGHYRVWAQAVGFERAEGSVALGPGVGRQTFTLRETTDLIPQLSGYQIMAALPEDTVSHRRGKAIFHRSCTYCHEASTALQNRFDRAGWEVIIGVMLNGFQQKNQKPLTPLQKELAAYLTEMRGPDSSPMRLKAFGVSGASTLPVVYEYDVPYEGGGYAPHNGSDWRFGPGSSAGGGGGLHDAVLDSLGNIWFTSTGTGGERTIGAMDTSTGRVTNFVVHYPEGKVARSHGIYGSSDGKIYFNASGQVGGAPTGNSILGMVDPRTRQVKTFAPPPGMMLVSGWLGEDAKGNIWTAGGYRTPPSGALRFDPRTETFTEFRSVASRMTYGITGDRDGNGWWMGVNEDVIEYSDIATGKVSSFALPEIPLTEYLKPGELTEHVPVTGVGGKQSPRRPRADHTTTDVWVPTWFGNTIVRIDTASKKVTHIPMPYPAMNPYEIDVDTKHGVWVSFQNGDEVGRYDPATGQWTFYTWPTRGTAQRQNNVVERNGVLEVIGAAGPATKLSRMVMRTPQELEALRARTR
jgi:streptogramin lyase